ncbi:hypothetical protein [Phytomonospora endophytica]|uniref:DUF3592 domain-containing protein n=1 Tax=Phytomonospora endophytica TaxID=714109 RepID=A0A841FT92_9ACTN|nr:hypothetical protein [Phytomonospora endophytica]MBB6039256.1 hypothetical protein [Phytomonospora endophytica]GIG69802.1 hypothetical protein Pen01_60970 [Phytomonospora endophytica]
MKPCLHLAAVLAALAAGLGLATVSMSAWIPSVWLQFPMIIAGIALPLGAVYLLYWPFESMLVVAPMIATVVVAIMLGFGLSGYLLDLRGEVRTATVTEYVGQGTKGSGYLVRVVDAEGREVRDTIRFEEPYGPGDRVEIIVDPEGWAAPTAAGATRPGGWFPWAAGVVVAVLAGFYVAGVRRELSRSPG